MVSSTQIWEDYENGQLQFVYKEQEIDVKFG